MTPDRGRLMFRRAVALFMAADERRVGALEQARDALLAEGEKETAAEAEAYLSRAAWFAGHRDFAQAHLERAEELLEGAGPSVGRARVLSFSARLRFLDGAHDEALQIAGEALALAERLGLDELRAHALTTIGSAKMPGERVDRPCGAGARAGDRYRGQLASGCRHPQQPRCDGKRQRRRDDARTSFIAKASRAAERIGDRDNVRFMQGTSSTCRSSRGAGTSS